LNIELSIIQEKNLIRVNPQDAVNLNIDTIKMTLIRFGYKVADIHIEIDNNMLSGKIEISENVIKRLQLPVTESYLIQVKNNELILGPYIGLYMSPKAEISGWKIERLKSFILRFKSEINGVMIAFTYEDINFEKLEVNAFYYDSINDIWVRKKMPLPTVIHRYGDMNKSVRNRLRAIYGNNLFNYDELDKWSEISGLIQDKTTKKYISDTKLCENIDMFKAFINQYDDFYFKPIKGRKGRGIHRIEKESESGYYLTVQAIKEYEKIKYDNVEDLIAHLYEAIHSKDYILQRTIKLSVDNRVIDFRVRFEKNLEAEWELSIFAARVSGEGGVVSNRSAGGEVIPPIEALTKYYGFGEEKAKRVEKELVIAGEAITKAVEKSHVTYLKCAVDLGVEPDGTIYHIETNVKAPNDLTTRSFEGYAGLDRACSLNSLYCKRMTGFKDVNKLLSFSTVHRNNSCKSKKGSYLITFGGSNRTKATIEMIKETFLKANLEINFELVKKFHYQFIVYGVEENIVDTIKTIKEQDVENIIRTVLIETSKTDDKVKKKGKNNHNQILQVENQKLKKEIEKMKESTSWQISKPIRLLGKIFKKEK